MPENQVDGFLGDVLETLGDIEGAKALAQRLKYKEYTAGDSAASRRHRRRPAIWLAPRRPPHRLR